MCQYEIFADMCDGNTEVFTYSTYEKDIRLAADECERIKKVVVLEIKRIS